MVLPSFPDDSIDDTFYSVEKNIRMWHYKETLGRIIRKSQSGRFAHKRPRKQRNQLGDAPPSLRF